MPDQPPDPGNDAFRLLSAAVTSGDAAETSRLLDSFPALKSRLDEPLPDAAFGGTALLRAVGARNRPLVDILLTAGADINARSHWWAGSFGVLDHPSGMESYLIERGARVDAHAAARLGMIGRLRELVNADPSLVNARGGDGQTPLHFASTVEIAEFLLDHGAPIDVRDIDHESTPAQYMVDDRQDVARHLIGRGCRTDILMAAALGDLDLVKKHLAEDPAVIEMRVDGEHFPMSDERAGGSIYIWTLRGARSPHAVARRFAHPEVLRYLMETGSPEQQLVMACELGDKPAAEAILTANPGLEGAARAKHSRQLVAAAEANDTSVVRMMLELGWPADAANPQGETALHWAGFHGNPQMAAELLQRGARLDVEDSRHHATPLGWADYGSRHGWYRQTGDYPAVIQMLSGGSGPPLSPNIATV